MQAERLDGALEDDLAAIDGEAAGGDRLGNVARGDGAVELTGIAGRADGDEGLAVELRGNGLGFLLQLEVVRLELGALALEVSAVLRRGAQRLLLRQQDVARVSVLDVDDVAHLAEAADALQENDFHDNDSLFAILKVKPAHDAGGRLGGGGGRRMGQIASANPSRATATEATVLMTNRAA
jgi:hypothetical protein